MKSFGKRQLAEVDKDKERIIRDMRQAYVQYGHLVAPRVQTLRDARLNDGAYHRVFCIVKGMLSSGLALHYNIPAGHALANALIVDPDIDTERMIDILKERKLFQGRSAGQSVRNVYDAKDFILGARDEDMTYENLIAIRGVGPKIASWILSLYFGDIRRFTLDVHMYRGLFGTGRATTDAIHQSLETVLVQWCTDLFPNVPPLVLQWSLWCKYRGDTWDRHDGIVRAEL